MNVQPRCTDGSGAATDPPRSGLRLNPEHSSLTERLALRLAHPVDDASRRRAALLVQDWLGCALGALRYPLARQLANVVRAADAGMATAIGIGRRSPESALLLNAALGNVLEMDDVHRSAILHPGPVVIPVALAATEAAGGTAQQFLDAVVRGYEATIRIGRSLGTEHYRYWHPTSTAGAFGAAEAAASVLGLDVEATADALGTAGSRTGGLWQMRHEPVPTKSIHNAEAARSGWLAAQLTRAGLRGPRRILEGEQGLYAATAAHADPAAVCAADDHWQIHGTSLKPWPACRHAHPAIDAMLAAMYDRPDADPRDIERIDVTTYVEAVRFCDRPQPRSELEAKFSLQHTVAVVACFGRPQLAHYTPEVADLPELQALRQRVAVHADPAFSARFPMHYGAAVRVTMKDGRRMEATCTDAWGDPERPMDSHAVRAKALALAAWGGVSQGLATRLFDTADALVEGGSIRTLCQLLTEVPTCA